MRKENTISKRPQNDWSSSKEHHFDHCIFLISYFLVSIPNEAVSSSEWKKEKEMYLVFFSVHNKSRMR